MSRSTLYDGDGVERWCKYLEQCFKDSPGRSLAILEEVRYTVNDARNRKDPADYIATIVVNGKNSGIAEKDHAQVLLAYNHMDSVLRDHLTAPHSESTIEALLDELRVRKENWFDRYSRQDNQQHRDQRRPHQQQRQDKGKQQVQVIQPRTYIPFAQPVNPSMLYPRQALGYQPYAQPVPYQNQFARMPGPAPPPAPASQIKQEPGLSVNQRNLPDGRQQLQITDSRNNPPRQFGQQGYQHYNNRPQYSNNNNRNGYGQQQPRTYHAGNDDQAQYYDETQQYQAYEDGYYSTADFTGNDYVRVDTDEDGPTDKDDTHDDTVESHFTSPLPPGPSSRTTPSKKT
ncbi:MAG: hypothetical protein Q9228_007916, partial [Teloschistes exilis]